VFDPFALTAQHARGEVLRPAVSSPRHDTTRYGDVDMVSTAATYDEDGGEGTRPRLIGNYDVSTPEGWAPGRDGAFAVSRRGGAVGIRALEPRPGRMANLVNADPNSNLVHSRTIIPTLQHTIAAGETVWYVSAIYAKPEGPGVAKETYLDGWDKVPELPEWLKAEMA